MTWMIRIWGVVREAASRWFGLRLRTYRVEGDILPAHIRPNQLIHLVDDGESWSASSCAHVAAGTSLR